MKVILTNDLHCGFTQKTDHIHRTKLFPQLKAEDPDILCVQGDWGTTKPEHTIRLMKQLRKALPHTNILGVLGNHDLWDGKNPRYYNDVLSEIENGAKKQEIVLLNCGEGYRCNKLEFYGFMGWYGQWNFSTNDPNWMANFKRANVVLTSRAADAVTRLETDNITGDICLTHFPPFADDPSYEDLCANLSFLDRIAPRFRYLFTGHSHRDEDFMVGNCRVLSSGSDYDKPRYKVLEINPLPSGTNT